MKLFVIVRDLLGASGCEVGFEMSSVIFCWIPMPKRSAALDIDDCFIGV